VLAQEILVTAYLLLSTEGVYGARSFRPRRRLPGRLGDRIAPRARDTETCPVPGVVTERKEGPRLICADVTERRRRERQPSVRGTS
jgi:hypothetical protein